MVHEQDREKFRALLLSKRNQLLDHRDELGEAWRDLHEREPEAEERAQNESMSRNLESLEEKELAVVIAIDEALRKLQTGSYGVCTRCGESIPEKRLEAIPWTPLCVNCAGHAEKGAGPKEQ